MKPLDQGIRDVFRKDARGRGVPAGVRSGQARWIWENEQRRFEDGGAAVRLSWRRIRLIDHSRPEAAGPQALLYRLGLGTAGLCTR